MSKHTPGPWEVGYDGPSNPVIIGGVNKLRIVALTSTLWPREGDEEANAHLIAAAPELFAALDAVINGVGDGFGRISPEEHDQALAALAKARGEE